VISVIVFRTEREHIVKAMLVIAKEKNGSFFPLTADKLFCGLSPKSYEILSRIKRVEGFRKGSIVYAAGEIPSGFYVPVEGQINLRLKTESGNERIVRLVEPSEIFGLTETIAGVPSEMSAETITPCLCEYIAREDFIRFLQDAPELSFRLMSQLAVNLQKNYQKFVSSIT
jgi:CRP-like cAMP-binding protein